MSGVSIELRLFTGFSHKHQLDRMKAELSGEEAGFEVLILVVRQDVRGADPELRETYAHVQSTKPLVREAEASLCLARERYDAGAGTLTDRFPWFGSSCAYAQVN